MKPAASPDTAIARRLPGAKWAVSIPAARICVSTAATAGAIGRPSASARAVFNWSITGSVRPGRTSIPMKASITASRALRRMLAVLMLLVRPRFSTCIMLRSPGKCRTWRSFCWPARPSVA